MGFDREKILTAAQKHIDRKKYDRAIAEYEKLIELDPSDARTLLKIGDLQARMRDYSASVATYDRVGNFYFRQGFALKAIAVFKQIRELIEKQVPELADQYAHIVPTLAEIYTQLGLTSDALAAYDEVAARLSAAGQDREAVAVFRRMVKLDPTNPLPHLRLAEASSRIQELDAAIKSFAAAADLLMRVNRKDDALKVFERILHFRAHPRFAQLAAELYLDRNTQQDGLQALAKLQVCFQHDPKNLGTLGLLARAFTTIGQPTKAIEVQKEMARIAVEQGQLDLHRQLIGYLLQAAPHDEQVQALARLGQSQAPPAAAAGDGAEELDLLDEVEEISDVDEVEELVPAARYHSPRPSAPDVVVVDEASHDYGASLDPRSSERKALVDAESFRGLRLYTKAIETLQSALERQPRSIPLREKLRDIFAEAGDRDGTIDEMLVLATLYMEQGGIGDAEALVYQVLEAEPEHARANQLAQQLENYAPPARIPSHRPTLESSEPPPEGMPTLTGEEGDELPAYDLVESEPPARELENIDDPFAGEEVAQPAPAARTGNTLAPPAPAIPAAEAERPSLTGGRLSQEHIDAIEETLEEAEFFVARGLTDDAVGILLDQWQRTPNHALLRERLLELGVNPEAESGTRNVGQLSQRAPPDDNAFNIAASLDALEEANAAAAAEPGEPTDQVDVDQVFAKFKEGVRAQVSENDSATHYDLGVAYKEMGLLPDAINEFQVAGKDPKRQCMCQAMIGMIHLEQGQLDEAVEAYIAGLEAPQKTIEQEMSLYYDLGVVHEMKKNFSEALYYYEKISRKDPGYRDVKDRLQALRPKASHQPHARAINDEDDFDAAFDDMFEK